MVTKRLLLIYTTTTTTTTRERNEYRTEVVVHISSAKQARRLYNERCVSEGRRLGHEWAESLGFQDMCYTRKGVSLEAADLATSGQSLSGSRTCAIHERCVVGGRGLGHEWAESLGFQDVCYTRKGVPLEAADLATSGRSLSGSRTCAIQGRVCHWRPRTWPLVGGVSRVPGQVLYNLWRPQA